MAKTYQYCVAENCGKGFIESNESSTFKISGYPANIWRVPAYDKKANLWIAKVLGTPKTKDEAQTILDDEITAQQTAWDNNNVDGETAEEKIERMGEKPTRIVLEE